MRKMLVIVCVFICAAVCIGLVRGNDLFHTAQESGISEEEKPAVSEDTGNANNTSDLPEYEFESDLWEEDADLLFEKNAEKIVKIINNGSSDTVDIESDDQEFLSSFLNDLFSAYLNRTMPDLSDYYVNTTGNRIGNRLLLEAYFYNKALVKENTVHEVPLTIQVYNTEKIDDICSEITFYVSGEFVTDDGNEAFGEWFIVDLIHTEKEAKLLKSWVWSDEYVLMQDNIVDNYSSVEECSESNLSEDIRTGQLSSQGEN